MRLPAHAAFETYSVLTRLPRPHRANPTQVLQFLERSFKEDWLALPSALIATVLRELAERGVTGGATYDGLIAATVRSAGLRLYSCDRRAMPVYAGLGIEVEFIG